MCRQTISVPGRLHTQHGSSSAASGGVSGRRALCFFAAAPFFAGFAFVPLTPRPRASSFATVSADSEHDDEPPDGSATSSTIARTAAATSGSTVAAMSANSSSGDRSDIFRFRPTREEVRGGSRTPRSTRRTFMNMRGAQLLGRFASSDSSCCDFLRPADR